MDSREAILGASQRLAQAIGARDPSGVAALLAPGFVHRTHGGPGATADGFLKAIAQIPGEILFVRLDGLVIDEVPGGALVTGVQHARVRLGGEVIDDRRGFVDYFVQVEGGWRVQAAVDLPAPEPA